MQIISLTTALQKSDFSLLIFQTNNNENNPGNLWCGLYPKRENSTDRIRVNTQLDRGLTLIESDILFIFPIRDPTQYYAYNTPKKRCKIGGLIKSLSS